MRRRLNADLLYLHAAAARAGHRGACRDDARARALAVRLLDDPPCRVPVGASAAAMAAAASCSASERARAAGDQTHDWGWGSTMGTTGGQHVVIDTAVVRGLAMAYMARDEIGLTAAEATHIREHVRAAAYNAFYFYPALRLNQINWPIEIYAAAADVTGDERLLRNDCRAQLSRFARALTSPVPPWRIPFTGPGYRWHYLPQYSDRHPRNLDSAEYATIVSQAVMFYDRARAAGMPALDPSEVATIRAWLERVLCGYWTHAGYLNWDTGLSFARWHQAKKHGLCLPSLMAIALAKRLQPSPAYGRWAKHLFDRALQLYERTLDESGELPPAVPSACEPRSAVTGMRSSTPRGCCATPRMAATRGLGRLPAETPPPLYAYDPDIGRLAITTPHYNTAILAVNPGAVPYGGMEPARLFDGDQRVAASIGGRPYASFGVVVTDHASGHRTETQRGRAPARLRRSAAAPDAGAARDAADPQVPATRVRGSVRDDRRGGMDHESHGPGPQPAPLQGRPHRVHAGRCSRARGAAATARTCSSRPGADGRPSPSSAATGRAASCARAAWISRAWRGSSSWVRTAATWSSLGCHAARARALLHPAAQSSAPDPGPTLAVELLDGERLRRIDVTMRYAPARDAAAAARVAARLRSAP